ncbi:MAG: HAD family hydrolase [Erysipelotrichaceae bacterium]|nr:HAD family hydrolase [Erysipelotrichaceae bacterium]
MIKAVIFDFDGTLSNRKKNAYDIFDHYFKPFFSKMNEMEYEAMLQDMMLYDCNGTIDVHTRLIAFLERYGSYLPEDFEEKFIPYYYDNMYRFSVLKPETVETLLALREKGLKLGLLSNGDSFSQHNKIDHVQVAPYFDAVMVSGDIGIHKPDRRIYDMMSEKLGVNNEECLMVGDVFSTDILGAYNAGMPSAFVCTDPEKQLKYYKGYRIEDLRQILNIVEEIDKTV